MVGPVSPQELAAAFEKFTEVSRTLEAQYQFLRSETESLRARIKQKDEQIARATRLATLGETAAALAHEIRNPLCALKLFLSLLKEEVRASPVAQELVGHMTRTMEALDNVVENVLHFAKDNHPTFAPLNLHAVLGECALWLTQLRPEGLNVLLDCRDDPFILGNEHALRQVFTNLLKNASEAMPQGGTVRVSCGAADENFSRVVIEDEGQGFPEGMLNSPFEPFQTNKRQGTGLGLAVVRKILEHHRAEIGVTNREAPHSGARIEILFNRTSVINHAGTAEPVGHSSNMHPLRVRETQKEQV
jgi:signal transduction histidine kinase